MNLSPWMLQPIRVAAKVGFLSKSTWENAIAKGKLSWRNEQWQILKQRGLFSVSERYDNQGHLLVLTGKGIRSASDLGLTAVLPPVNQVLTHDELGCEFALRLESDGLILDWLSEAEIKQNSYNFKAHSVASGRIPKYPDLLIRLSIPGEASWMAIEIEKTKKTKERYDEFVNNYKVLLDVDTVIVLAKSQDIIRAIKRAQLRNSYPQHLRPFVYGLIDNVMKNPAAAPLDFDGRSVNLESTVQVLRTKRNSELARKASRERRDDRLENGQKVYV